MELRALRARLRRDWLDDDITPYRWGDTALNGFFDDAQRQVCLRKRALIDSVTAEVCTYTLAANQRLVRLHPSVLAVRSARIVGQCGLLTGITAKRLWKEEPGWDVSEAGLPQHWIPDYQDRYLALDVPMEEAGQLQISVWRAPLEVEQLQRDRDEPVIAEAFHTDLIDWAAYCAYNVADSELRDEAKAANALQSFEAKVGRLPSATEIRLWGMSPIVGVPAEFL